MYFISRFILPRKLLIRNSSKNSYKPRTEDFISKLIFYIKKYKNDCTRLINDFKDMLEN